ncbi:MAG: hypothetical protein ABIL25_04465, partial [candidate division WOR-3 bacterium]
MKGVGQMALTMREKQAVTKELARRYARANRSTKTVIINQVTELTGYNRSYATRLLRAYNRRVVLPQADRPPLVLSAATYGCRRVRARPRVYDEQVLTALKNIWEIEDY